MSVHVPGGGQAGAAVPATSQGCESGQGQTPGWGTPRACLSQRDEVAPSLMPGESQVKLDISTHLSILGMSRPLEGSGHPLAQSSASSKHPSEPLKSEISLHSHWKHWLSLTQPGFLT